MKHLILIYGDLWVFITYYCVFSKRISCVFFLLLDATILKNDDESVYFPIGMLYELFRLSLKLPLGVWCFHNLN